jgi:hypothetical protein
VAARPAYRYQYWSHGQTKELADDVRVNLRPRWLFNLSVGIHGTSVEAHQQERSLRRDRLARKLEKSSVVHRFTGSEEIRATQFYVRGAGRLTLMFLGRDEKEGESFVSYGTVQSPAELTAHVCLFGSINNFTGFRRSGRERAGWAYSAWPAIQELIDTRGTVNNSQWDNEARAFEAARWAKSSEEDGRLVFDKLMPAEWCALIYSDVTPTPGRWHEDWEQQTGRILVGTPLWVRTVLPAANR